MYMYVHVSLVTCIVTYYTFFFPSSPPLPSLPQWVVFFTFLSLILKIIIFSVLSGGLTLVHLSSLLTMSTTSSWPEKVRDNVSIVMTDCCHGDVVAIVTRLHSNDSFVAIML